MKVTDTDKEAIARLCNVYRRPNGTVNWLQARLDNSPDWMTVAKRGPRAAYQIAGRLGLLSPDGTKPKWANSEYYRNRYHKLKTQKTHYIPVAERRRRAAQAALENKPVVHVSTTGGTNSVAITPIPVSAGPNYCPDCGANLIAYRK